MEQWLFDVKMSLMLSLYGLWHQHSTFMLQILYISDLQPFLYNRLPAVTLLENRPYLWFFPCQKILFWFENNFCAANEISTRPLVSTNQNEIKCIWRINVIHFQKKQLVLTNANLAMVFICKLFQSRSQVGQFKSYGVSRGLVHVKTFVVFVTHVRCLTETLLRKMRRGKRQ